MVASALQRRIYYLTKQDGNLRGSEYEIRVLATSGLSAPAQPQSFFEFVSQYPFESGEVDARLALEPVAQQAIDVQIEVTQSGAPLDGVRVKLLRDGQPVGSAPTEKGRCTFSALTAARYEFEIRKGGTEVGRMVLDIRGDGTA